MGRINEKRKNITLTFWHKETMAFFNNVSFLAYSSFKISFKVNKFKFFIKKSNPKQKNDNLRKL